MHVGYIYRHWIINDKNITKSYVGQVLDKPPEKRWDKHGNGYRSQKKFYNAIKKYGWDNFNHEILLVIRCEIEEEIWFWLDEWECYYIEKYDSFYNGYNNTLGGKGVRGYKHPDEVKRKLSELVKGDKNYFHTHIYRGKDNHFYGKFHTNETKKHLSDLNIGKKATEETKKKMSESHKGIFKGDKHPLYGKYGKESPNYGRKNTEETKEKISESRREYYEQNGTEMLKRGNNPNARKVICLETNEVFGCIADAKEKYGNIDISGCCRGKQKSAGKHPVTKQKLHWMYYDEYIKLKKEGI